MDTKLTGKEKARCEVLRQLARDRREQFRLEQQWTR